MKRKFSKNFKASRVWIKHFQIFISIGFLEISIPYVFHTMVVVYDDRIDCTLGFGNYHIGNIDDGEFKGLAEPKVPRTRTPEQVQAIIKALMDSDIFEQIDDRTVRVKP